MSIALPKITPAMAAELAGKSAQFIRIGMQRNLLDPPIGKAFKLQGSEHYCFDIRPQKLAEYLGVTVEDMYQKLGFDTKEETA
ncbi:MAG: hypothetical protein NC247_06875 [Ruminococcus flavefaciens]|nr:hypothetical protein [Ruminococcus flavefaciens]